MNKKKKDICRGIAGAYKEICMIDVKPWLDTIFNEIAKDLVAGNDVYIHGFGTFYHKQSKPRRVHHPATGEWIMTEAKDKICFSPASNLAEENARRDVT